MRVLKGKYPKCTILNTNRYEINAESIKLLYEYLYENFSRNAPIIPNIKQDKNTKNFDRKLSMILSPFYNRCTPGQPCTKSN